MPPQTVFFGREVEVSRDALPMALRQMKNTAASPGFPQSDQESLPLPIISDLGATPLTGVSYQPVRLSPVANGLPADKVSRSQSIADQEQSESESSDSEQEDIEGAPEPPVASKPASGPGSRKPRAKKTPAAPIIKRSTRKPPVSDAKKRKASAKADFMDAPAEPVEKKKRGRPSAKDKAAALAAAAPSTPRQSTTLSRPPPSPKGRVSKRAKKAKEPEASGETADEWEVETIVDDGIDKDSMQHMYLVKWKGYSSKDNTWEPKVNLGHCIKMIADYEKAKKRASTKK